jgi:hypothetical protein
MSNNRYSQREEMIFLQWSIYTWNGKKKREVLYFKRAKKMNTWLSILVEKNPVKPAHMVTSIKQSPVLKGHPFLVLS